jgi:hypothetical protein
MSMKITRLRTYWSASEASSVIEFLDLLRDQLWDHYGEKITAMLHEAAAEQANDDDQHGFDFDHDPPF